MEVDIVLHIHVEKEGMDATEKYLVPMSYVVVAGKSGRIVYPIVQAPLEAARTTQKRIPHERCQGTKIRAEFNGQFKESQVPDVEALIENETGILNAATAFGKTVVCCDIIAKKKVNTL